ncbi:MAG TPA: sigma-70 family RNA polymerase sigma factor [Armatimonadota bacterium]|nr:sigma-70 family RNA polymerase sigma factor [Armatimonadota bacterium]
MSAIIEALAPSGVPSGTSARRATAVTDEHLMAEARGGCDAAFEALMHRHYRLVANFAARMTGRHDLAGDIAQHAFVTLYDQRRQYRRGARFLPWLYTIVRRRCARVMKIETRTVSESWDVPGDEAGPAEAAEDQELIGALRAALHRLPERERGAVIMFHYMQWSYDDIAETLGCKPGAARTAACRGRARLRELLVDFEEDSK